MTRDELSWALRAVQPHAGAVSLTGRPVLGMTRRQGSLFVFGTDRYSAAVAKVPDAPDWDVRLDPKVAAKFEQAVRPRKVPERAEVVEANVLDGFELIEHDLDLDAVFALIAEVEELEAADEAVMNPTLLARFAKAERELTDRLVLTPKKGRIVGAAGVRVGSNFRAAIAGMKPDPNQLSQEAA